MSHTTRMQHIDRKATIAKLLTYAKKHKKESPAMLRVLIAEQCRKQDMSANTVRDYVKTVMERL